MRPWISSENRNACLRPMTKFNWKPRYLVLLITIISSVVLYYLSYLITHALVYSSFSRLLVKVFSIMDYFSYVIGIDIIILAILTLHLMTTSKLRGNIELYKGFLYSFIYVIILAVAYSLMWILGKF